MAAILKLYALCGSNAHNTPLIKTGYIGSLEFVRSSGASLKSIVHVVLDCETDLDQYEGWDGEKPAPDSPAWFRAAYWRDFYARLAGLRLDEGMCPIAIDFDRLAARRPDQALRISKGRDATYKVTPDEFIEIDFETLLDCSYVVNFDQRVTTKEQNIERESNAKAAQRQRHLELITENRKAATDARRKSQDNRTMAEAFTGRTGFMAGASAKLLKDADQADDLAKAMDEEADKLEAAVPKLEENDAAAIEAMETELASLHAKAQAQSERFDANK